MRPVCLNEKHYLMMTRSAASRSGVYFGDYTRGLNSAGTESSPGDDALFSHPASLLGRWGDDSLVRGRLGHDEEWNKGRVINAEALG